MTSGKHKRENKELQVQLPTLVRARATEILKPKTLEALFVCRLKSLDKNQQVGGSLQTVISLPGGADAARYSFKQIFEKEDTDEVNLVDASNAFSSLKRKAVLHDIRTVCPGISTVLINTYRLPVCMIILGEGELRSVEGTIQGNDFAVSIDTMNIL